MNSNRASEQDREYKRLAFITILSVVSWLAVVMIDFTSESEHQDKDLAETIIPPLSSWVAFSLQWPQYPLLKVKRLGSLNAPPTAKPRRESAVSHQSRWSVQLGTQQTERGIDPLLAKELEEVFRESRVIESRAILGTHDARQLALTEAALELKIVDASGQTLRLRIGAEHQRHSTWVRALASDGRASSVAWRVNQRLRRALKYMPEAWPDRRMGPLGGGELIKVSCQRGSHEQMNAQSAHAWSVTLDPLTHKWRLETDEPSPPLEETLMRAFIYSLQTLKVSTYLERGSSPEAISPAWRPTHSCVWETDRAERGWIDIGRARVLMPRAPSEKTSVEMIVLSSRGIGVIPHHIAHFITPTLSQLLKRSLSPVDPSLLASLSYTPSPTPLNLVDEGKRTSFSPWRLSKQSTGWWLERLSQGEWYKKPVPESVMSEWLSLLAKESASISYRPKSRESLEVKSLVTHLESTGASLQMTTASPRMVFTLQMRSNNEMPQIKRWYRTEDHADFTLSNQHAEALQRGPVW